MRRSLMFALTVICATALAGCGSDTGEQVTLSSDPPWGLESVNLPTDTEALADVFAAMPPSVDDVALDMSSPVGVMYSEGDERYLAVDALAVGDMPTKPGAEKFTTQSLLQLLVESGEYETLEVSQFDVSEPLIYGAGSGYGDDQLLYSGYWAVPDGEWVFSVVADSPETRTELVHAFIEACQTIG